MKYYFTVDKKEIMLEVPGSGYYPEEDSELFSDFIVKNRAMFLRKKVLEIGCGSGLLSILCARFGADVFAVDVNPDAVSATKENAAANGVKLNAVQSDLFEKIGANSNLLHKSHDINTHPASQNSHNTQQAGHDANNFAAPSYENKMTFFESHLSCQGKKYYTFLNNKEAGYDIIIFNSPYLPDEDMLTKKSHSINYNKGDVIKRFLSQYKKYLNKNGRAYILVSSITGEKIVGKVVMKKKIDWEELRIIELR